MPEGKDPGYDDQKADNGTNNVGSAGDSRRDACRNIDGADYIDCVSLFDGGLKEFDHFLEKGEADHGSNNSSDEEGGDDDD